MIDWCYGQTIAGLSIFFEMMGNMGAELFTLDWVQGVALFFSYFSWTLFAVGLVVAGCEFGIEFQTGRASIRDTALNALKGFLAVSLFSTLPVEVYSLCVSLQGRLSSAITGLQMQNEWSIGKVTLNVVAGMSIPGGGHKLMNLFLTIAMGYAVIKIFFANLKRGGILLIQIAVGSLYMFSIPRGYIDGFVGWAKQVIGVCLTAFLQTTVLVAGLMVFNDHALLGLGLMLSAGEIPRIAGQFGLETGTKANLMSAVYATQQAVQITQTVIKAAKVAAPTP